MSGVLRLGNTGAGTGRSTLEASASNDQTFTLPSAGGTLLTSNTSIPGGTITLDGATINITNGDLNVDSGTLFVDESSNQVGIGTTSPTQLFHVEGSGVFLGKLTARNSSSSSAAVFEANFNGSARAHILANGSFKIGGDLSGNGNIYFDAGNGTGTFVSDVQVGGNPYTGSPSAGVRLDPAGALVVARANTDLFTGKNTNTGNITSTIGFNGAAMFAGPINPGNSSSGIALRAMTGETGNCLLSTNTSDITSSRTANIGAQVQAWNIGYFSTRLQVGNSYTGTNVHTTQGAALYDGYFSCTNSQASYSILEGYLLNNSTPKVLIKAGGTAEFLGSVTSKPASGAAFYAYNGGTSSENAILISNTDSGSGLKAYLKYDGSAQFNRYIISDRFAQDSGLSVNYNSTDYGYALYDQTNLYAAIDLTGQISSRASTSINLISSERRLKENIVPVDPEQAWETIKSTPIYSFNYKTNPETTTYGCVVDEVPEELHVVTGDSDEEGAIRTYDNSALQARLYTALQTALSRIEALESEVSKLRSN